MKVALSSKQAVGRDGDHDVWVEIEPTTHNGYDTGCAATGSARSFRCSFAALQQTRCETCPLDQCKKMIACYIFGVINHSSLAAIQENLPRFPRSCWG